MPAESRILLSDFGEAFPYPKELKYTSRTPLAIRPLEARFEPECPLSFQSDIWTLSCTIWSIFAQRPLFEGFLATEDDMTCEHVDALGVLPPDWWRKWQMRRHRFTEDGKPINRNPYHLGEIGLRTACNNPDEIVGFHPLTQTRGMLFLRCYGRCSHLDQRIDLLLGKSSSHSGW